MRLPLRHRPPAGPAPLRRCAYLELLAEALVGIPLGPAAAAVASPRSRGRHGNALQWHLGLPSHDARDELDWEDRIEIKLVTVWARRSVEAPEVACDKLKVCDITVDPWRKLSNVLFVPVDRLTRVVVGAHLFHLGAAALGRLAQAWDRDPHFEQPALFVEAREQRGRSAPAYYLSPSWLAAEGVLPSASPAIFGFDLAWWAQARTEHGRDPLITLLDGARQEVPCPRCGGPLHFTPERVAEQGWSPARHGMPVEGACAVSPHVVVAARRLRPSVAVTVDEFAAAVESRVPREKVWRLADRVNEPEDHEH
jgi:hypothetical protein